MAERWTAETEQLVGREIWPAGDGGRTPIDAPERVLTALAEAGLLVTPQMRAVLDAAREWRASTEYPLEGQGAEQIHLAEYEEDDRRDALIAAVDALDASATSDGA